MGERIHQHESASIMLVSVGEVGGTGGGEEVVRGVGAKFGSYPTNLVPLGPSCSTGLTRLSPSLRAGSFLGR